MIKKKSICLKYGCLSFGNAIFALKIEPKWAVPFPLQIKYTFTAFVFDSDRQVLCFSNTHQRTERDLYKRGKKTRAMATLKVPASVPSPAEDAEQLHKAFSGSFPF